MVLKPYTVTEHEKYSLKVCAEENDVTFKIRLISQKLTTLMNSYGLTYGVCLLGKVYVTYITQCYRRTYFPVSSLTNNMKLNV